MTYAIACGRLEIVKFFIEGLKVNARLSLSDHSDTFANGDHELSPKEKCFCVFLAMHNEG